MLDKAPAEAHAGPEATSSDGAGSVFSRFMRDMAGKVKPSG